MHWQNILLPGSSACLDAYIESYKNMVRESSLHVKPRAVVYQACTFDTAASQPGKGFSQLPENCAWLELIFLLLLVASIIHHSNSPVAIRAWTGQMSGNN